tara:strand:+ start:58 stop:792 length:735 start_codon:yes stop_codon:yes gene_type:complete
VLKKTKNSFIKSKNLSNKHLNYFDVYDDLFNSYIDKKIVFVEVGVLNGGSLFMWRDYFGPKARIIGIDLNPAAKKFEKDGFEIFIGNQEKQKFWDDFYKKVGTVDILLDDGGHTNNQQTITTLNSIENINDDGLLVIEDTHTSYMKEFGNPSENSFVNFSKKNIDYINFRFPNIGEVKDLFYKNVFSISFFESIICYKINRKICKKNIPVKNKGEDLHHKDFRYGNPDKEDSIDELKKALETNE